MQNTTKRIRSCPMNALDNSKLCGLASVVAAVVVTTTSHASSIVYPVNGHSYVLVEARAIRWVDAREAAEALGGYLATLTDPDENRFVYDSLVFPNFGSGSAGSQGVQAWLGGFQAPGSDEPAGGWGWITGEPWTWDNWATGEPNDMGGIEHYLAINRFGDSTWNDEGVWLAGIRGFIVEFDGNALPDAGSPLALFATALAGVAFMARGSRK